jgi:hypothetical protein
MRAGTYILLFFVLLLAPFLLRTMSGAAAPEQVTAAADTLVIVSPHNSDIRREYARAFSQWHQEHYGSPVTLDFRSLLGTNNIKRLLQETYDSLRLPDQSLPPESVIGDTINMQLVWGGGDSFFNGELKPLGFSPRFTSRPSRSWKFSRRRNSRASACTTRSQRGRPCGWEAVCRVLGSCTTRSFTAAWI